MEQNSTLKLFQILLLLFIAVNLLILDLKLFAPDSALLLSETKIIPTSTPLINNQQLNNSFSCPVSCINLISDATKSASNIGAPLPAESLANAGQQQSKSSREYFIPLGSGTTSNSDWTDITATETVIDTANYGSVGQASITYSLRNPTQNGKVEVRLYNATDKYVVFGTQTTMENRESQTITTGTFAIPKGNKLYRVQMRSTLSYSAFLDTAKLKIVAQ